jgi:hypothetical protein
MNRVRDISRGSGEIGTDRITHMITGCDGGTNTSVSINTCSDDGNSRGVFTITM